MEAACGHCGFRHVLDDTKIANYPRVQFRCSKCGQATVVEVTPKPERTQAVSPLPSFARGGGPSGVATTIVNPYQGLSLPADKVITLSMIAGPSKGLVHVMEKPREVFGRTGADIEVNDPEVSRWHCAVEVKNDLIRLRDLDSTNGIYIEDERVRAAELHHLSEFRIGSTVVLLTITPKQEE